MPPASGRAAPPPGGRARSDRRSPQAGSRPPSRRPAEAHHPLDLRPRPQLRRKQRSPRRVALARPAVSRCAAARHDAFELAIRTNLAAWSRSLHRLRGCLEHQGPVRVLAWSPTGRSLATGSDDGTVRLWDPVTGDLLFPPLLHAGPIRSLAFTHDGSTLASASDDQTARLWNAARACLAVSRCATTGRSRPSSSMRTTRRS